MHTSQEWWNKTKNDPALLENWLVDQYIGEEGAYDRIKEFALKFTDEESNERILLQLIAIQEYNHAMWVKSLLDTRNIVVDISKHAGRYWAQTLPAINSFEFGVSLGAKTEAMRLARIRIIVNDDSAPADIREVFKKILPQEEFHEATFKMLAADNIDLAQNAHAAGMEAIGLIL